MNKVNLLLVDDEQKVIKMWKNRFTSSRYSIYEAKSGEKAIEIVKGLKNEDEDENALLVVLMDVLMPPGMDGIEVLKRIKTEFPFCKVYIITGNVQIPDIPDTAYNTGIYRGDGFYRKQDLVPEELVEIVEKGIREQETQLSLKKKDQ